MTKAIIQLDHINVTFQQKGRTIQAVKDTSIHINQGDIYGIVGYSGAGKSTLVRVVNLLQSPSAGKVTIDDTVFFDAGRIQLTPAQLREKRREIGMIFQHFNLMSQLTAEQNVMFALKHSSLSKEERKAKVKKLLDLVGLSDRAQNYPAQLSGGQKQRVAIARALANDPKILISDEATSALDPKTTKQILALLSELNQKLGLTIVLITHEMQIVKDIANRVAVMQEGQLIEEGSVLEIFSHPEKPLTQDFIQTATGIEEALIKINKQEVVEQLAPGDKLVQLNYAGAATDAPLINDLHTRFGITSNILYANIEILDHTPVGELVVVLSGDQAAIRDAQNYMQDLGVQVKVLKEGV